jgi:hypothetical protein
MDRRVYVLASDSILNVPRDTTPQYIFDSCHMAS